MCIDVRVDVCMDVCTYVCNVLASRGCGLHVFDANARSLVNIVEMSKVASDRMPFRRC